MLHPLQVEWDADLRGGDPLAWPGYLDTLASLERGDSVVTGRAAVDGARTTGRYVVLAGRFECLGGSMGAVHGERVVRAYRRATIERLPVVVIASSGGARIQEGMVALAQLARTAGAARAHASAGLLSVAVLRPPTTGGVLASYVSLTDVRAAEPGATIGFAGPRVVELTTGSTLPPQANTAESAHMAGLVDALVAAADQAAWLEAALGLRDLPLPARPLPAAGPDVGRPGAIEVSEGGAWLEVLRARARSRPSGIDQAARLCQSWVELRGSDPTVRAGLARIGGRRVVVVANDRHCAGGRPGPGGYRLAQRAIALAGRLGLPLLTLVDTPGADPSPASEAGGIAAEIARTLAAMAELATPTVSVCVGEGGSGGALALAGADRLLMCEHAIFSVLGPEGAAAILARTADAAPTMAGLLRLTSTDVVELGIADAVVADDGPELAAAVGAALDKAVAGDRTRRFDRATARWLR
ncbi:MAG TPA: carboxyl transferase domain-containing protein [Acidimicrobiales bacterium]|jgi:acetyl-CoA carboxylase alpha subunit|nr:carboxyl transferase domain-containing protein [Acidimicrobiales bacterium]